MFNINIANNAPLKSCNNCKVKSQRKPRWMRQRHLNMSDPFQGWGCITTTNMFRQRGMTEQYHDVLDNDGINLRYIAELRRRERDQMQSWKRKGHTCEKY